MSPPRLFFHCQGRHDDRGIQFGPAGEQTMRTDANGVNIRDHCDLDAPVKWQGTASATRRTATG